MDIQALKELKPILKHLVISVGSAIIIVLLFFYWYLPVTTNHGETITVPNITNQHIDNLDEILLSRSLRYEVNADSGFSTDQGPLTVLDQFPKANSKVKENRKIYITLNAKNPPKVKMPNVVDKSLKIAQITLQSFDLKLGKTEYQPDLGLNVVLEQKIDGRVVLPGETIPKGSVIDLVVGDGNGNVFFKVGSYADLPLEEAHIAIVGSGLNIGQVIPVDYSQVLLDQISPEGDTVQTLVDVSIGDVVKQAPSPGTTVRIQDVVDLWVYQPDSLSSDSSILD